MGIAANKVPGIRAALVGDETTAALVRQHNDVNVLCLSGKNTAPEAGRKILDAFLNAKFEGGRHERRVLKLESQSGPAAIYGCAPWIPSWPGPSSMNACGSRKTLN